MYSKRGEFVKFMEEFDLQNRLFHRLHHMLVVPNTLVFGWESDVVSVTTSGYMHEFECKVTEEDLRADSRKEKFQQIIEYSVNSERNKNKFTGRKPPNYFWYIVPSGLCIPDVLPVFAGLIYWDEIKWRMDVIRKAQRLHTDKVTAREWQFLARSLMFKYWKLRTRTKVSPAVKAIESMPDAQ